MTILRTPEDIHIQLIRARSATSQGGVHPELCYAQGVQDTILWLLGEEGDPLTEECQWLPKS